ncbi:DUF6048 family protein [Aquimarina muelleri]|uniref:Outer membrane protein beta-barrel domain-containing protein n=1 Tax=Aquimarina muelleri TaxID=279356 RepID=A0A918JZ63_9FLAO|nr:DUF6048 family protein [Aquimarina muelleri]MCX2764982.1 DUF6048 family protein [Aquimarina muelleri]GGX34805.1 hypothetical protein GCM10007384_39100 [Aquimarina muelleri]
MKQLHTYLFFISILISGSFYAQEETKISAKDTLPPSEKYGFRAGVDLGRLIRTAADDKYSGFEIIGDYRFYKKFYIAAEIGNESLLRDEENINIKGSGNYIRAGIDYNVYDNWYGMQNSIYVGLRYGFSTFDQTLNDYSIFTGTNYFGANKITESIKESGLNASWIELVLGIKVELVKNLYLGANVSLRSLVSEKTSNRFDNLYIPGFGRTNDFSSIGVGYGYSISYLIPFFKKKK